ncbi:unnamed protein product [Cunninghamella echinulata]
MQLPFRKPSFWKKSSSSASKQRQKSVASSTSSNSGKSVHFSDSCSSIYYTYGSGDYDRGSTYLSEEDQLNFDDPYENIKSDNKEDEEWDEQVKKNTKVNQKRGHHTFLLFFIPFLVMEFPSLKSLMDDRVSCASLLFHTYVV